MAQLVGVSPHTPKGCGFDSGQGTYLAGLWVRFLVEAQAGGSPFVKGPDMYPLALPWHPVFVPWAPGLAVGTRTEDGTGLSITRAHCHLESSWRGTGPWAHSLS